MYTSPKVIKTKKCAWAWDNAAYDPKKRRIKNKIKNCEFDLFYLMRFGWQLAWTIQRNKTIKCFIALWEFSQVKAKLCIWGLSSHTADCASRFQLLLLSPVCCKCDVNPSRLLTPSTATSENIHNRRSRAR